MVKSERLHERTSEADRQVKRLTGADKRAYIDGLAEDTEDAAKHNQQGTVCTITKLICGKYQANANTIIKEK